MKRLAPVDFQQEILFREYLPLVHQVVGWVQRRLPKTVDRNDLLAAGMIGLWQAICKTAALESEKFECYARTRIRGAVFDELRTQDWLTRRIRENALTGRTSIPSITLYGDEDTLDLIEYQFRQTEETFTTKLLYQKELRLLLKVELAKLPVRQQYVLTCLFFKGMQTKELAITMGITEPRVSQIASKGLARLKASSGLKNFSSTL